MITRFEPADSKILINLIKNIFTMHNESLDEEINNNFLHLIKSVEKVDHEVRVSLLENIQKILIFLGEEPGLDKERIFDVFIEIVLLHLNNKEFFKICLNNIKLLNRVDDLDCSYLYEILKTLISQKKANLQKLRKLNLFSRAFLENELVNNQALLNFIFFILKEEINYSNDLSDYLFFFKNLSWSKAKNLALFLELAFSKEKTSVRFKFKLFFLGKVNLLKKLIDFYYEFRREEKVDEFFDIVVELFQKNEYLRAMVQKYNFSFKKILNDIKITDKSEINRLNRLIYLNNNQIIHFPRLFMEILLKQFESDPSNFFSFVDSNRKLFLKNASILVQNDFNYFLFQNFQQLLVSDEEILSFWFELLEYNDFSINSKSAKIMKSLSEIINYLYQEGGEEIQAIFLQKFKKIMKSCLYHPKCIIITPEHCFKMHIPRIRLNQNSFTFTFWLRISLFSSQNFDLINLTPYNSNKNIINISLKQSFLYLKFGNNEEIILNSFQPVLNQWYFMGISVERNQKMFTLNFFANGKIFETRFFLGINELDSVLFTLWLFQFRNVNNAKGEIYVGNFNLFGKCLKETEIYLNYITHDDDLTYDYLSEKNEINFNLMNKSSNKNHIDFNTLTNKYESNERFYMKSLCLIDYLQVYLDLKNIQLLKNEENLLILNPFYDPNGYYVEYSHSLITVKEPIKFYQEIKDKTNFETVLTQTDFIPSLILKLSMNKGSFNFAIKVLGLMCAYSKNSRKEIENNIVLEKILIENINEIDKEVIENVFRFFSREVKSCFLLASKANLMNTLMSENVFEKLEMNMKKIVLSKFIELFLEKDNIFYW